MSSKNKALLFSVVILVTFFTIFPPLPCSAAITIYRRTGLTGGTATDLDGIEGSTLVEGDLAWIYFDTNSVEYKYNYRLNATSGASESSPDVIAPDPNAGSKRWILQSIGNGEYGTKGMILGDTTPGRVLRVISAVINNGTDPNTIDCEIVSRWNGDTIASEDNLAKSGSTTSFSLDAGGGQLTIKDSALTGTCAAVIAVSISGNSEASFDGITVYGVAASGIFLEIMSGAWGSDVDLTTISATKTVSILITYLTSE